MKTLEHSNTPEENTHTAWDDLNSVPFRGDETNKIRDTEKLRLTDEELIKLTAEWQNVEINEEALDQATKQNGNPNRYSPGFSFDSYNLPMDNDSVYRTVGTSAISDLMIMGFVRNKREAEGALGVAGKAGYGTSGVTVYWHEGVDGKKAKGDLVIQASKAAASEGYVTKDGVQGIWITDKATGQPVNLIDGQDHTGIELAPHKL